MKWYTSEPRKDCPILVKTYMLDDRNDPLNRILYLMVQYCEEENDFFAVGASNEYEWDEKNFLCWTPVSEIEKDLLESE